MSKRVPMNIDEMPRAKLALDQAFQRAMMLMNQKQAFESVVTLKITIEIDPVTDVPEIHYKANIRVPLEMGEQGQAVKATALEWDEDTQQFMMEIVGEQLEIGK